MTSYGWDMMDGWSHHGSANGGLMMLVFWILLLVLVVLVVRHFGMMHGTSHASNALQILKERYAKGEIDKKEFEEKKKDLA